MDEVVAEWTGQIYPPISEVKWLHTDFIEMENI